MTNEKSKLKPEYHLDGLGETEIKEIFALKDARINNAETLARKQKERIAQLEKELNTYQDRKCWAYPDCIEYGRKERERGKLELVDFLLARLDEEMKECPNKGINCIPCTRRDNLKRWLKSQLKDEVRK